LILRIKLLQPDARIITLTGTNSRELERRLRELGIAYYMAKPFQRAELQGILSHLSGRLMRSSDCKTERVSDLNRLSFTVAGNRGGRTET
jgi:DNA-binding response OmpR family regulator